MSEPTSPRKTTRSTSGSPRKASGYSDGPATPTKGRTTVQRGYSTPRKGSLSPNKEPPATPSSTSSKTSSGYEEYKYYSPRVREVCDAIRASKLPVPYPATCKRGHNKVQGDFRRATGYDQKIAAMQGFICQKCPKRRRFHIFDDQPPLTAEDHDRLDALWMQEYYDAQNAAMRGVEHGVDIDDSDDDAEGPSSTMDTTPKKVATTPKKTLHSAVKGFGREGGAGSAGVAVGFKRERTQNGRSPDNKKRRLDVARISTSDVIEISSDSEGEVVARKRVHRLINKGRQNQEAKKPSKEDVIEISSEDDAAPSAQPKHATKDNATLEILDKEQTIPVSVAGVSGVDGGESRSTVERLHAENEPASTVNRSGETIDETSENDEVQVAAVI